MKRRISAFVFGADVRPVGTKQLCERFFAFRRRDVEWRKIRRKTASAEILTEFFDEKSSGTGRIHVHLVFQQQFRDSFVAVEYRVMQRCPADRIPGVYIRLVR